MRRVVVACALVAMIGSGCDAFGDDVAATVDGIDITWDQVNGIAASAGDAVSGANGSTIDAEVARRQIRPLIELALVKAELARRGQEITEADRAAAADQVRQANPQFDSATEIAQRFQLDLFAAQTKLGTTLGAVDPTSIDEQRDLLDRLPALRDAWCFEQVQGLAEFGDAVEAQMRDGTAFADIQAGLDPDNTAGGAGCIDDTYRRSISQDTSVLDEPPGTVQRQDVVQQGTPVFSIIRNVGRRSIEPGSPEAAQVLGLFLQRISQNPQARPAWGDYTLGTASIRVDSRLGRWQDGEVVPVGSPLVRTSPTTESPFPAQIPGG